MRDPGNAEDILGAGLEAVVADPQRPGSILEQVADVTLVFWLLGAASGEPGALASIHMERLERVLRMLVDTPVRGFVYEAAGHVERDHLERGAAIVREAGERWRIPVEVVEEDPRDWEAWTQAMLAAAERLTGTASRLAPGGRDAR